MDKKEFKFGDKVLIKGKLIRIKNGNRRTWVESNILPTAGIFLGYRTLSNGIVEYESHGEEGNDYYFTSKEFLKGAWICIERSNPEKVLISQLEKI